MEKKGSILGATLLVAGTCIGGGMLALPVATGVAGFFPSLTMMLVSWAFMTITALLLAEASMWMEEGAHVITLASRLLGPLGKGFAWLLYLFISYASLIAYAAGGGELCSSALGALGIALSEGWATLLFVGVFGIILYMGNVILGRVNTALMFGLVIAYILLIARGAGFIEWEKLTRAHWGQTLIAIPLLLAVFSFQTIVPSLTLYLRKDGRALRLSIILGTTSALIVYALWELLVLGTVPLVGAYGLEEALLKGKPASAFLGVAVGNPWLGMVADFFAFFALVTSFLGIALGLFDFLADGLKIKRTIKGNIYLGLLVAIPTLFFTFTLERVFLSALDLSGGIGDSILNGLFPALMVWVGRYRQNRESDFRIPGGRPLLVAVIAYSLFVLIVELLGQCCLIPSLT